eukprot:gene8729-4696_t
MPKKRSRVIESSSEDEEGEHGGGSSGDAGVAASDSDSSVEIVLRNTKRFRSKSSSQSSSTSSSPSLSLLEQMKQRRSAGAATNSGAGAATRSTAWSPSKASAGYSDESDRGGLDPDDGGGEDDLGAYTDDGLDDEEDAEEWLVSDDERHVREDHIGCKCGADEAGAYEGLWIQCSNELCSKWQHGNCFGHLESADVPPTHKCHECRPEDECRPVDHHVAAARKAGLMLYAAAKAGDIDSVQTLLASGKGKGKGTSKANGGGGGGRGG